jgi:hypothetical protein
VIVNSGKIIFKTFPVHPVRFDILNIESKKKTKLPKARPQSAPFVFGMSLGQMTKKKANKAGKTAAKKTAAKKGSKRTVSAKKAKETLPGEVHQELSSMVRESAAEMTDAAIRQGKSGQLATVKYLFEMAGVFPKTTETAEGSPREDSLAETLLHRLNIPIEPVHREGEDEEPVEIGAPVKVEEDEESETELKPADDSEKG